MHVDTKCSSRPWHPPRTQFVIDHIGIENGIFVQERAKGIGHISRNGCSGNLILVGQSITAQDFNVQSTQGPRSRFNPLRGCSPMFLFHGPTGQPFGSLLGTVRIGTWFDAVLLVASGYVDLFVG